MHILKQYSCIALLLLQYNIALSKEKEGEIKYDKEPWDCIPYLLRAVDYIQFPTKLIRDTWSRITTPTSVKDFNIDEFGKAKARYIEDGENVTALNPESFEEKLAFIEVYSEKVKILPLRLGDLMKSKDPTAKKRIGKLIDGINIKNGMSEQQVFNLLVSLYKIEYRAPSVFWSDGSVSQALTKRVQVELLTQGISARLKLTRALRDETEVEKAIQSTGFKVILTAVLNAVAYETSVPIYLPNLKKIRISAELLSRIEADGLDAHLNDLKQTYGSSVQWGQFYEKIRPAYMIAAGTYTAVYAYSYIQQYMLGQSQREHPPKQAEMTEHTLKMLGLK